MHVHRKSLLHAALIWCTFPHVYMFQILQTGLLVKEFECGRAVGMWWLLEPGLCEPSVLKI